MPIIRVENLGKKYAIRQERPERYVALRDVLTQRVTKLFSFPKPLRAQKPAAEYAEFWALQDIHFEVQPGDCVGIIGRNGAGKSTLLKILSRITEPTTGRVELRGRVASLLEVGAGFHPELTGRENILLHGAILGLRRAEIRRKFDEIVDFSGVEQFLDTPVKRYSSGMYVRLAFSVAAHLEPEILIVDEVLAVGDAEFQKKCLGKLEAVRAKTGRTVLFVSHHIGLISSLCNIGIYLQNGRIAALGSMQDTITHYTASMASEIQKIDALRWEGPCSHKIAFTNLTINGLEIGCQELIIRPAEKIHIQVHYQTAASMHPYRITCALFLGGVRLFSVHDTPFPVKNQETTLISEFTLPGYLLRPGVYQVGLGGHENDDLSAWFWCAQVCSFTILEQWDACNEPKNFGVINVPAQGRRYARTSIVGEKFRDF
jgi:lipopolysaccharide transport system ATP-binding protein